MESYRDLPMDLADASLVVAAKELGEGKILSTDRRAFGAYRWKGREPFRDVFPAQVSTANTGSSTSAVSAIVLIPMVLSGATGGA